MKPVRRALTAAILIACSHATLAFAQADYPSRPITIIVPYAAGGGADQVTRLIAQRLSERLKQTVIVDDRGGASNTIGMNAVARAAPDGYTLGLVTPTFLMTPSIIKNHPYDPIKDFSAIGMIGDAPLYLAVHPSVPANNIKELIAYAKARPGKLNWASGGTASTQGLAGLMFSKMAGIKTVQVQYKGSSQGMTDLLGGTVQYMFNPMPSIVQHAKSGKLKILGVANLERSKSHPEMPAIAETVPGYHFTGWFGLVAPAGTPKAVVDRLSQELTAVLKTPATRDTLVDIGLDPQTMTPDAFAKMMNVDIGKYADIFAEEKIKPQ
jgi:tripartite-type tricarboxylate transporter receptor subunit TctC